MMNNDNISIVGIEIVEEAVELAKINAKNNGIKNYTYISSTAKDILNMVQSNDIIIVDPPRKGLDKKLVDGLIKKDVKNIVYVSCNANTLARDYSIFKENGYILKEMACVDMFPNTIHVETVALLSKLDVDKHIDVEIELDELDLTSAESKATYAQIKEYVWNKFELKVPTLYIAQIKRKCGIELREHYNKSKKEKQIIPQCTPEKEEAIMDALRHFKMIE